MPGFLLLISSECTSVLVCVRRGVEVRGQPGEVIFLLLPRGPGDQAQVIRLAWQVPLQHQAWQVPLQLSGLVNPSCFLLFICLFIFIPVCIYLA